MADASAGCDDAHGTLTSYPYGGIEPFTYLWSTGSTDSSINNLTLGAYDITVTDANGCSGTQTAYVYSNQYAYVNFNSWNATCGYSNGWAEALFSENDVVSYEWSNGETTQMITGLAEGEYTVTVTSISGCTATNSIYIYNSSEFYMIYETGESSCANDGFIELHPYAGIEPYTFEWNDGPSTDSVRTGLAGGYYYVTISGCRRLPALLLILYQ